MAKKPEHINASHKAALEHNAFMADEREAKARRHTLGVDAWSLLLEHGTPAKHPDYRNVRTEVEAKWIRHGGRLERFRQIFDKDNDVSEVAAGLAALQADLGVAAPGESMTLTTTRASDAAATAPVSDDLEDVARSVRIARLQVALSKSETELTKARAGLARAEEHLALARAKLGQSAEVVRTGPLTTFKMP